MTTIEFVARLENISVEGGVQYGRISDLLSAEAAFGEQVLKFKGYLALSDAFKCHFLETAELIDVHVRSHVTSPLPEFYPLFLVKLTHAFHLLCGAERAALHGYPYLGYTSLRNIFDNVVMASAALQKLTDFYAMEGIAPGKAFDLKSIKKKRKDTEFAVREQMTGQKSGMSPDVISELKDWDDLYDLETHGSRLSLADAMDFLKGRAPLPVVPQYKEPSFAIFVNRYCEVAWMTHRLIPLTQPSGIQFPQEWSEKWAIIDDSFSKTVLSLTDELKKPIGAAIAVFLEMKFPFNAKSQFTYDA